GIDSGVSDLLFRIRGKGDVPINGFFPTENVAPVDSSFIGKMSLAYDTVSIDANNVTSTNVNNDTSIDTIDDVTTQTTNNRSHDVSFTIIIDIKVHVTNGSVKQVSDATEDEISKREVHAITGNHKDIRWYADIVNYLAANVEPEGLKGKGYMRKKIREAMRYHWDEHYLYKHCFDG